MEFTVSKSDLVRELSLSQGVVEKKTTIPILSNVLLEAAGGGDGAELAVQVDDDSDSGVAGGDSPNARDEGIGSVVEETPNTEGIALTGRCGTSDVDVIAPGHQRSPNARPNGDVVAPAGQGVQREVSDGRVTSTVRVT